MTSFRPKSLSSGEDPRNGSGEPPRPGRNGEADFRKTKRSNETHASTTDKDARLYRKGDGPESRLGYLGHALMENRNGLVVAAEATLATGTAEREAAARLSERLRKGAALGADKGYDAEAFVEGLKEREIAPHVAINGTVSKTGKSRKTAVPPEVAASLGYAVSQRLRKRIGGKLRLEQGGGWSDAGEGARTRQSPRRFRPRHGRLQHRPPAQTLGSEGRSASGNMKSERKRPPRQAKTSKIGPIRPRKIAPALPLAETQ